jgi:UDP-3-O-acyl-N-acetylglucosamine deacetylase
MVRQVFCWSARKAGVEEQNAKRKVYVVKEVISINEESKEVKYWLCQWPLLCYYYGWFWH